MIAIEVPDEDSIRHQVYDETTSDTSAAKALGISRPTFRKWRQERGLSTKNPRGHLLPPEVDAARRKAYEETGDDFAAGKRFGMSGPTFRAWRLARDIAPRRAPGQRTHMTRFQAQLLVVLREHPWTKEHEIWKLLDPNHDRFNLHDALKRLEAKDYTQRGFGSSRAVVWAPVGVDPPKGVTRLMKGAPSLYHAARLSQRILDVLTKEPWLPIGVIVVRLRPAGTPKSVEQAVRGLLGQGRVHRRLVDTFPRKFYVYALPGAKRLGHRRRGELEATIEGQYGHGAGAHHVLEYLGKGRGWHSAREISEGSGVRLGFVYNTLKALLAREKVRRVRIHEVLTRWERGNRYVYALAGVPDPPETIEQQSDSSLTTMARIALIVKKYTEVSSGQVLTEFNRTYRHVVSREYIETNLNRLSDLGVVRPIFTPYARSIRAYRVNGGVNDFVAKAVDEHWRLMEHERLKILHLGYRVKMELIPPDNPPTSNGPSTGPIEGTSKRPL